MLELKKRESIFKKKSCDWESSGDIGVAGLEKWFDFTGVRSKG